ncbi:MAG: outer membrane beta-barrel protein [Bacteroidetes bacterium]|nr:outer membrane beta-barrel protein [Bacteroidota bacterium]
MHRFDIIYVRIKNHHIKKYPVLLFLIVILATLAMNLNAQSFEKGNKIIDAGIKISIYNIDDPDDNDEDGEDDRAASYTIPIGFEYAISDRIGAGIEIGICNYFTEEDTITRAIAKANSFDVLLKGNFHWVRKGKADLYSGLGLGFSSFKYESNDNLNSSYKATGPYIRISVLNARLYLADAFALGLHFGLPIMNFEDGKLTDDLGTDLNYRLRFSGWDLGASAAIRF